MIKKSDDIVRVAIYLRVSTDEQAKDWYGLDFQENDIKKLIEFKSSMSPKWVSEEELIYLDDGYSWKDLNRPAFKRMMEDAKRWLFDLIVVWKIDRMSRNLSHLLKVFQDLKEMDIVFYSLKENIDFSWPIWKLVFQIFWALAEFEREMIQMRTSEWKKSWARLWNYTWNWIPYWYKVENKKFIIVEDEAKIFKKMILWFTRDGLSLSEIERKINDLKVEKWVSSRPSYKWTKWNYWTIKNMFGNSTYMWKRVEKHWWEEIIVEVPPIIDESLFDLVQIKLEESIFDSKKWWWEREYLLSRLIVDMKTRKFLYWYTRTKDKEIVYRREKVIIDGIEYSNIELSWKILENFVLKYINWFISNPEEFYKLYVATISSWKDLDSMRDEIKILEKNIEKKEFYINNVVTDCYNWGISPQEKEIRVLDARKDISNFEKSITNLKRKIKSLLEADLSKEVIEEAAKNYSSNIEDLSFDEKRRIIKSLVNKITVLKEDWRTIKVGIYFKFGAPKNIPQSVWLELSNLLENQKNTPEDVNLDVSGRKRGTRTHNPALPKRVR